MQFKDLRLIEPIVRAVASQGYTAPTPIQSKSIPHILSGRDMLGCARTGTGKTGAFALPILQRLAASLPDEEPSGQQPNSRRRRGRGRHPQQPSSRLPRALILCPTRELASQIIESFCAYGRNLPLRHTSIFGGVSQYHQVRSLQNGVDVLAATPGRLMDLMEQGHVDLSAIEVFVLDEADRMLDMGFIHDIRKIADEVPSNRQSLLFSATMPAEIRRLADRLLHDPVFVEVDPESTTAEHVTQSVYHVSQANKPILLERLLVEGSMDRTLVFTRTKHGADKIVHRLKHSGIRAVAIHGNKSQSARTHALNGFKAGRSDVLVATDIASRGIDVDEITHVVNFDIPNLPESYVHRIGRTARAGASGMAVSFCGVEEIRDLKAIERLIKQPIDVNEDHRDLTHQTPSAQSPRRSGGGGHGLSGNSSSKQRSFNGRNKMKSRNSTNTNNGGGRNSRPRRNSGPAKAVSTTKRRGRRRTMK